MIKSFLFYVTEFRNWKNSWSVKRCVVQGFLNSVCAGLCTSPELNFPRQKVVIKAARGSVRTKVPPGEDIIHLQWARVFSTNSHELLTPPGLQPGSTLRLQVMLSNYFLTHKTVQLLETWPHLLTLILPRHKCWRAALASSSPFLQRGKLSEALEDTSNSRSLLLRKKGPCSWTPLTAHSAVAQLPLHTLCGVGRQGPDQGSAHTLRKEGGFLALQAVHSL